MCPNIYHAVICCRTLIYLIVNKNDVAYNMIVMLLNFKNTELHYLQSVFMTVSGSPYGVNKYCGFVLGVETHF